MVSQGLYTPLEVSQSKECQKESTFNVCPILYDVGIIDFYNIFYCLNFPIFARFCSAVYKIHTYIICLTK